MHHPIYDALKSEVLLFDGATGTYAKSLPDFPSGAVEHACLLAPDMVYSIHKAYIDAGSRLIKTNTFAAHPGLAAKDACEQKSIITAAYAIAKRAAREDGAYVFADIGPSVAEDDPKIAYCRAADCFLGLGADCFLFETMQSAQGICEAAAYIKSKNPSAFIAVSFAADPDGFTGCGEQVRALMDQMDRCKDIDAVGLNCVCGAYHMRRLFMELGAGVKPRIIMPNAGYPHRVAGRIDYESNPGYFAAQTADCIRLGASIVGGCCGTTPAHISRLSKAIADQRVQPPALSHRAAFTSSGSKSRILQKLRAGEKAILVELDPPKNAQLGSFLDGAKRLSASGADAITIADCPIGRARMDSSLLACKLTREYGIEALPHMTCRDRNVNATKALLLGLSMEGVHNVLAVTGDPVPTSDRGSVKSVFQFNSRVLARFISSLCDNGDAEPFFLCGALNINADNFAAELEKAIQKEACGIQAFLTQPLLTEKAAENLKLAKKTLRGYVFAGLFPIVSEKNALFMASEVAGVKVDPRIIKCFKGLDRRRGEELALRICMDAAGSVSDYADGYYIMTPFQRYELVRRLVLELKKQ